ncbi:hypothetical protein CUMW_061460 [Citrus unshiu]|uniref:Uncharacterized protein n=1 Tax=Citrus unshiu TaxID=55188 RepID=A0A2H5NNG6_CITUN|nr:hypothetical protein CUMW_061460 [Citrus unshiu]
MKNRQHDNVMNLLMLLSRSKMTNRIVALHSRSKRNDAVEKNGTLLCFAGCVGSSITSELLTKHLGSKCYPALLLLILPILQSWTSFLNIVALPCYVSRTFSIQSGLLAPVYSFVIDNIQGIFLWRSFLLMLGASMTLFFQMKQQVLVRRTCRKEMIVGQSTLVHLRHSDRV